MSAEFPKLPLVTYDAVRAQLRSGDLLLASGRYMFSRIIQQATGSCWSHVAFILRVDAIDRVMVLESIESRGVRTVPLSEYVDNFEGSGKGYNGRVAIARHADFDGPLVTKAGMRAMSQFAVDRLSYPYDEEEVGRITARIVAGALGLPHGEIVRNEEYICSEYVGVNYQLLGIEIAYDKRGFLAPADFVRDPKIALLWEIEVKA